MRKILSPEKLDGLAIKAISGFHPEMIKTVEEAIQANKIVIVGMAQNPFVKKARKALDEKHMSFKYVELGNYFSMWKERLAIKLWSGWPTFPQVFVEGKLIGGFKELELWLQGNGPT